MQYTIPTFYLRPLFLNTTEKGSINATAIKVYDNRRYARNIVD